ncbi:MAG TPA: exodeoxyribonuclease VII large subunit, partial [Deferrisomatales bacterium]|nr:exodeoxyribonuclease VII large subunit [Deferrisomatales bacterium]
RGDVQLVVEDLELEGEGLLRLELEARKRQLAAEGLFDPSRKRCLPQLPRAIGVVTSATGAALQDILQVLGRRAPGVDVLVSPSRVQGEGAAVELCAALELIGSHPGVEVVILGRGGGAAEDLGAFNDAALVRAVAACPVPVVSAVGHEIDLTLCDLVADLRAPTPSAAAELAAGEWRTWAERLVRDRARFAGACRARLGTLRAALERRDPALRSPRLRLQRLAIVVDRSQEALAAGVLRRCHGRRAVLARLETRLARCAPRQRLRQHATHLTHLTQRLRGAVRQGVAHRRQAQQRWRGELGALSPLGVLERGYALVRTPAGAVVRDAAKLSPGCGVTVRLTRGELDCTVDTVRIGRAGEGGDA